MDIFPFAAFFLLGIERFLYGYVYHFPWHFKAACKNGAFGLSLKNEPLYWKAFMRLGVYVKVFQYSVALYDLLVRCNLDNPFWNASDMDDFVEIILSSKSLQFYLGLMLVLFGQLLNIAVFKALGGIGVYYGW